MEGARQNKSFLFKYMRRSKKNKPSAPLLKLGEITTTKAVLVTNGFQDHFISVYADPFDGPHPVLSPRLYDTALCQVTFGVADVGKLLKQVNPYSAMVPDYIHSCIQRRKQIPWPYHYSPCSLTNSQPGSFQQHGKRQTSHPFINLVIATHLLATAPLVSPAYHAGFWRGWSRRRSSLIFRGIS